MAPPAGECQTTLPDAVRQSPGHVTALFASEPTPLDPSGFPTLVRANGRPNATTGGLNEA
jgi:hypothetical protein